MMPSQLPINRWIFCFNGYAQGERWRTGVGRIHRDILAKCSAPDTYLQLCSWRDDVSQMADNIMEWGGGLPEVVLIGYSYGGWTAVLLCRELKRRGFAVDHLVLIDAVWRWQQRLASISSLFDGHQIAVPDNVKRVTSWRQKVSKPMGHPIVGDEKRITIDRRTLNVAHLYADDVPEVRELAVSIACSCEDMP